jgi:hypothetical protein
VHPACAEFKDWLITEFVSSPDVVAYKIGIFSLAPDGNVASTAMNRVRTDSLVASRTVLPHGYIHAFDRMLVISPVISADNGPLLESELIALCDHDVRCKNKEDGGEGQAPRGPGETKATHKAVYVVFQLRPGLSTGGIPSRAVDLGAGGSAALGSNNAAGDASAAEAAADAAAIGGDASTAPATSGDAGGVHDAAQAAKQAAHDAAEAAKQVAREKRRERSRKATEAKTAAAASAAAAAAAAAAGAGSARSRAADAPAADAPADDAGAAAADAPAPGAAMPDVTPPASVPAATVAEFADARSRARKAAGGRGGVPNPGPHKPNRGRVKSGEVVAIGTLRTDKGWHNNVCIFPDGFCTRKDFRSSVDLEQHCIHECSIHANGIFKPGPTFRIVAADRPAEPLEGKSATMCWSAVLARRNGEIERRRAAGEDLPPPPKTAIPGPEYFGLYQAEAVRGIEALDPSRQCLEYWRGKEAREGMAADPEAAAAAAASRGTPKLRRGGGGKRRAATLRSDSDGDGGGGAGNTDGDEDLEAVHASAACAAAIGAGASSAPVTAGDAVGSISGAGGDALSKRLAAPSPAPSRPAAKKAKVQPEAWVDGTLPFKQKRVQPVRLRDCYWVANPTEAPYVTVPSSGDRGGQRAKTDYLSDVRRRACDDAHPAAALHLRKCLARARAFMEEANAPADRKTMKQMAAYDPGNPPPVTVEEVKKLLNEPNDDDKAAGAAA